MQRYAPGLGEYVSLVGEARGNAVLPELAKNLVGDGGGAEEIGGSLGALLLRCLRGKEGEGRWLNERDRGGFQFAE